MTILGTLHRIWSARWTIRAGRLRLQVPAWLLAGIGLRLLVLPFHHPWDLQTWYNMFVDLAQDQSPYETLRYHTFSTRAKWGLVTFEGIKFFPMSEAIFYAYYAYPPLPLLLYYPLAKLYAVFYPVTHTFVMQGAIAAHNIPLPFFVLFKLPLFAADVGVAALLWRLAGEATARMFFLNPFIVLVSGAWMIESPMAFFALAALYLVLRGLYAPAGVALALGTLAKWVPAVLWPVVAVWLLRQRVHWRGQAAFHAGFILTLVAGVLPFWEGLRFVAQFHASRPGANLTPHVLLDVLAEFRHTDLGWYYHVLSPYIGALTLPLALGAAYLAQIRRPYGLSTAACLTVVAFLLGSKIVNEPYVYLLIPLLLWERARRPSEAMTFLFKAVYALPLAYAVLNVPVLMFLVPLYLQFRVPDIGSGYGLAEALPGDWHAIMLASFAFGFVTLLVYAWWLLTKEAADDGVHNPAHRPYPDFARLGPARRPVH